MKERKKRTAAREKQKDVKSFVLIVHEVDEGTLGQQCHQQEKQGD